MPRQQRQTSGTGIYHVMLRGINHQDIFEDREDYWKFLRLLRQQTFPEDNQGKPLPPHCIIYAYCLMPNHVHLLIRELDEGISAPISSISIAYAQYFNKRYEHSGHLFQDRFKSEPVNDMTYFVTLLRYIHQNPIAAGIAPDVRHYPWSSWCEYQADMMCIIPICTTQHVFARLSAEDLTALVNEPCEANCVDVDNSRRLQDSEVRDFIVERCGAKSVAEFQRLTLVEQTGVVRSAREEGASIRQVMTHTGWSYRRVREAR